MKSVLVMRLLRRSDGRYYAIFPPTRDLFGDRILITYHGSVHSKMGGVKTYFCASDEAIVEAEKRLTKTRLAHGYQEVPL